MNHGIRTFIYPFKDLASAKTLYVRLLGVEPYVDGAYYVGFKVGAQEIGLDPNGHQGMTGPVGYLHVDDIRKSLQALLDAGAQTYQEVNDVGAGKLIASVKDAHSNVIGLVQSPQEPKDESDSGSRGDEEGAHGGNEGWTTSSGSSDRCDPIGHQDAQQSAETRI